MKAIRTSLERKTKEELDLMSNDKIRDYLDQYIIRYTGTEFNANRYYGEVKFYLQVRFKEELMNKWTENAANDFVGVLNVKELVSNEKFQAMKFRFTDPVAREETYSQIIESHRQLLGEMQYIKI